MSKRPRERFNWQIGEREEPDTDRYDSEMESKSDADREERLYYTVPPEDNSFDENALDRDGLDSSARCHCHGKEVYMKPCGLKCCSFCGEEIID